MRLIETVFFVLYIGNIAALITLPQETTGQIVAKVLCTFGVLSIIVYPTIFGLKKEKNQSLK